MNKQEACDFLEVSVRALAPLFFSNLQSELIAQSPRPGKGESAPDKTCFIPCQPWVKERFTKKLLGSSGAKMREFWRRGEIDLFYLTEF